MTKKHKSAKMRRGLLWLAFFKNRKEQQRPEDQHEGCTCVRLQVEHHVPEYFANFLNLYNLGTPPPEVHETPEIRETPTVKPDARTPPAKEKRAAGNTKSEFEKLFLKPRKCLQESTCRIAVETNEKLSMIARSLGGSGATVKSYVNNILDAHLEQYRDEIKNLINNAKNKL